jgi:hypothetical protein
MRGEDEDSVVERLGSTRYKDGTKSKKQKGASQRESD